MQLFYFIFYRLFGLNVNFYHVFQLLLHSLNSVLVFYFVRKITKKDLLAAFSAFLFSISATHFYELTWVASTFNSIALFYILLYLLTSDFEKCKRFFIPEIFFVLSILSIETAVVLPFLLFGFILFFRKIDKNTLFHLALQSIIVGLYLTLRFVIFKIPTTDSYSLGFSSHLVVKNIIIFIMWLFNFSEPTTIHLALKQFPVTDAWFTETFQIYPLVLSLNLIFLAIVFVLALIKSPKKVVNKFTLFGGLWFIAALLPVLIIPKRVYPYYPFLAQIGLWIAIGSILFAFKKNIFTYLVIFSFIATSFLTLRFLDDNHWVFADPYEVTNRFQAFQLLKIPKNIKYVVWQIDSKPARSTLYDGVAFNILTNDFSKKYILDQSLLPSNLKESVYDINYCLSLKSQKKTLENSGEMLKLKMGNRNVWDNLLNEFRKCNLDKSE